MNNFRRLSTPYQRLLIGVIFITIVVGLVILKDMITAEEDTRLGEHS